LSGFKGFKGKSNVARPEFRELSFEGREAGSLMLSRPTSPTDMSKNDGSSVAATQKTTVRSGQFTTSMHPGDVVDDLDRSSDGYYQRSVESHAKALKVLGEYVPVSIRDLKEEDIRPAEAFEAATSAADRFRAESEAGDDTSSEGQSPGFNSAEITRKFAWNLAHPKLQKSASQESMKHGSK
jgi:hypothetical protein